MKDLSTATTAEIFAELRKRKTKTPAQLIELAVQQEFGVTHAQLHMKSNKHSIAHPRQAAMALMYEAGMTHADIAAHFGFKCHGTALNAVSNVRDRESDCQLYASTMRSLRAMCGNV